jgi:DNA helicase-2/ATP-dependent DNA helicase PcrA
VKRHYPWCLDELDGMRSIFAAYTERKRAGNVLDYDDLLLFWKALGASPETGDQVASMFDHVLVDEYQDTNALQADILEGMRPAGTPRNLTVVGDDAQAIYGFRAATVRNILEFPQRFPGCSKVKLTTNYRSHEKIVAAYDRWMASADWSNPNGPPFRFDKTIEPDPQTEHPGYPAVFSIWGGDAQDEARRFADFVAYLKEQEVIVDYNQVALLLHSVRLNHSGPYIEALAKKGIPAFCPRARSYFENEEVRLMVGCFAVLFGYHGDGRGELRGRALQDLGRYTDECIVEPSGASCSG